MRSRCTCVHTYIHPPFSPRPPIITITITRSQSTKSNSSTIQSTIHNPSISIPSIYQSPIYLQSTSPIRSISNSTSNSNPTSPLPSFLLSLNSLTQLTNSNLGAADRSHFSSLCLSVCLSPLHLKYTLTTTTSTSFTHASVQKKTSNPHYFLLLRPSLAFLSIPLLAISSYTITRPASSQQRHGVRRREM